MLPALIIFLCYYLLKKKGWNPINVILMLVAVGFIGGAFGILAKKVIV
jgi:mannose/fructose/N-acetylgalactosamine-specific phosphotransferase system component IID